MAAASPARPLIVDEWRHVQGVVDAHYIPAAGGDALPCKVLVIGGGAGLPDEYNDASVPGQVTRTLHVWPLPDKTGELRPRYLQQEGHFDVGGVEHAIASWSDVLAGDQFVKWQVTATTEQPGGGSGEEGP